MSNINERLMNAVVVDKDTIVVSITNEEWKKMTDMLKKSEKINTSDEYVKSDNLTEQWNKGKLPEGDYYIKRRNGYLPYDNIDSRGVWRNSIDEDIVEVLDKVPSYEEWQGKKRYNKAARDIINTYEKENKKLKKLLRACRHIMSIEKDFASCHFEKAKLEELLTKIDEVLK